MDHGEQTAVIEQGGQQRRLADAQIAHAGVFGHDKGDGPHDRRHDQAAGAGHGLHRARKLGPVAHAFHERNGEGSRGVYIGRRAAGHAAEQGGTENGRLGRPALGAPGDQTGQLEKHAGHVGFVQNGPEQDEQKDDAGRCADGGAPYAVVQQIERFDDAIRLQVQVSEIAGQAVSEKGIGESSQSHDDQRPAGETAGGLKNAEHQSRAQNDLQGRDLVDLRHALGKHGFVPCDIGARGGADRHQQQIPEQHRQGLWPGIFAQRAVGRAPQKDQRQNQSDMDGTDHQRIEQQHAQRGQELKDAERGGQHEDNGAQFLSFKHVCLLVAYSAQTALRAAWTASMILPGRTQSPSGVNGMRAAASSRHRPLFGR